jgi:hypothetical protein
MKSIYVAGASREVVLVEEYLVGLRACGYHVTYDWCAALRKDGPANPRGGPLSFVRDRSEALLEGVRRADVLWMLVPGEASAGAWVEVGAALALQVPVVVSGDWEVTVFSGKADRRFETHDAAFDWLRAGRMG